MARLAPEGSQPGIWKALTRLSDIGVVDRQDAGSASLYTLNREHLAAPGIEALVSLRTTLLQRIRDAIEAWEIAPAHLSMFGSAARGDGDVDSDIDLFVVRPAGVDEDDPVWTSQLDRLSESVRRWTGNPVAVSELSTEETRRLAAERPPIAQSLEADAITLAGTDIHSLLRTGG